MLEASSLHVRALTAIALVLLLLFAYLNGFNVIAYDQQVATARTWNYVGATLPIWALATYYALWNLFALVGLVGMFWFWRPARWIVATTLLAAVLFQPFFGLLVLSALERTLSTMMGITMTWLVVLCFWSPVASRFRRTEEQRVT